VNFNGAAIHLLINHVPVIAYPFVAAALLWGLVRREESVVIFACYAAVVAGVSAITTYLTGDGAEEVLRKFPDFNIEMVHTHEDTAFIALLFSIAASLLAVALLPYFRYSFIKFNNLKIRKLVLKTLLSLCLIISAIFAVAAHQGGLIRHTEIRL
jgi:hypothetical protein